MSLEAIITCAESTKDITKQELVALGASDIKETYAALSCQMEPATFYAAHLKLRTASRILQVIKSVAAKNPIMLTSQSQRLPWPDLLPEKFTYLVEGIQGDRGEEFMSSNDVSKAVRLGLENAFKKRDLPLPRVDLKEPTVIIVAHARAGRCTLSFDTSGKSLHKRGYKTHLHPAPIKETLAAAILLQCGYDGSMPLFDPFCGSGTFPIEAAYIALNKAPLIHRKKGEFLFEELPNFDRQLWRDVQDQVRSERATEPPEPIFASDIYAKYVSQAQDHALRARVEKHIKFASQSFFDAPAPAERGLLVANLPYGERIGKEVSFDEQFYRDLGDKLKRDYNGWTAALLVAENSPYKMIGLRPKRRISMLNGMIPVKLLIFELYEGSKRQRSRKANDED